MKRDFISRPFLLSPNNELFVEQLLWAFIAPLNGAERFWLRHRSVVEKLNLLCWAIEFVMLESTETSSETVSYWWHSSVFHSLIQNSLPNLNQPNRDSSSTTFRRSASYSFPPQISRIAQKAGKLKSLAINTFCLRFEKWFVCALAKSDGKLFIFIFMLSVARNAKKYEAAALQRIAIKPRKERVKKHQIKLSFSLHLKHRNWIPSRRDWYILSADKREVRMFLFVITRSIREESFSWEIHQIGSVGER